MKIIQANKYFYLKGGAERYVLDLSSWLQEHGHEVVPFAMKTDKNRETPYERFFPSEVATASAVLGWQGIRTLGRMIYSREAKKKMTALIAATKPDVCHVHNIYTQLSPSILSALRAKGIPVVMTVHDHHLISPAYNIWAQGCGKDHRNTGLMGAFRSKFHKGSSLASLAQTSVYKLHRTLGLYRNNIDVFICPSRYMKRQLVRGGFPEEKIQVVPYGIHVDRDTPSVGSDSYFLYVGRLSEEKGVAMAIRAAKLAGVPLKIVGDGPQANWLHKLAHGSENIEFLGFRSGEALADLYRGAMAVVLPSRVHENAPLVILEAAAHGKLVIASDVGGVGELVQDHQTGLLLHPLDLDGWTEAMLRIYHDSDLQSTLAKNARAIAEQSYTLDRHYMSIERIYQSVQGSSSFDQ